MNVPSKKLSNSEAADKWPFLLPFMTVMLISFSLTALIWIALSPRTPTPSSEAISSKKTSLFASNYPANGTFQRELVQLKNRKDLKESDELEIQKYLLASADYLEIPPALAWCLLFQESRLNHLEGIELDKPSSGLGQFSRFSFFEINSQLDRFSPNALNLIYLSFGRDIRPIAAKSKDTVSSSSYFSIPTAVTSSTIYLHNRYFQLSKILEKRAIDYNPDILWLFAAMAYNKGSRSVIALWNLVLKKQGQESFYKLLHDYDYFNATVNDPLLLTKSISKIWEDKKSKPYAAELGAHIKNISACSVSPLFQTTRSLTGAEP